MSAERINKWFSLLCSRGADESYLTTFQLNSMCCYSLVSVIKLSVMYKMEEQVGISPLSLLFELICPSSCLKIPYNYFLIKVNSVLPIPSISLSPFLRTFCGSPLRPPYSVPSPFVRSCYITRLLKFYPPVKSLMVVARRVTTRKSEACRARTKER